MASLQDLIDDFVQGAGALDDGEREVAAKSLVEKCGYAAAALTILPIPFTEWVAVMPIHVGMVVGIGHLYGEEISRDSAKDLVLRIGGAVGLSVVGSRVAMSAAKFLLPGLGGLLGAPFMYASTIAIGAVARLYFQRSGRVSDAEIKSSYRSSLNEARKSFDPKRAQSNEAKGFAQAAADAAQGGDAPPAPSEPVAKEDLVTRLERLKAMLDKGLIDQAEFDAAKKRILDEV